MQKKCVKITNKYFVLMFAFLLLILQLNYAFAFWYKNNVVNSSALEVISVGLFDITFEYRCCAANLIIDNVFYEKYMQLNEFGEYVWKRTETGDVLNMAEIKQLTPIGTIIKSDMCYLVKTGCNLIDHGIPNKNFPLGWAYMPLGINYVDGWTYTQNHVVKTSDGQFFMAKWYTTENPLVNRTPWNKIESVVSNNFYHLLSTMMADYSKPKLSTIVRSYNWDYYTNYVINDKVLYDGIEYVCTRNNSGNIPPNNTWCWGI